LQYSVGDPDAPPERVAEIRARRVADERVGQGEIPEQGLNEALAHVNAQGLVELARAEPTVLVGRRELDLQVGRDLRDQISFLDDDDGRLQQHVTEAALGGRAGRLRELTLLPFP